MLRRFRSSTRSTLPPPRADLLDLQSWLLTRAQIPTDRLPSLLELLDKHWINDVSALTRALPALERHLPAAAFLAIQRAALNDPPPSNAGRASTNVDTASDDITDNNLYASPVKFTDGDGIAFSQPLAASTASPSTKHPYRTMQEAKAARAASFRRDVEKYRALLQAHAARALSPHSALARIWEQGVLALAVAFTLTIMPVELALAEDTIGPSRYDTLWFVNRAVEVAFCADVAHRVCLAYREPPERGGLWVFNRRRILLHYLRTWLAIDVLAATPVELGLWGLRRLALGSSFTGVVSPYERLLRLLRLLKLLRPGHVRLWLSPRPPKSDRHLGRSARLPPWARAALQLVVCAVLLVHWLACAWAFAGMRSSDPIRGFPLWAPPPPSPPFAATYPSPPHPPAMPSPAPPPFYVETNLTRLLDACWLHKHGLLVPPTYSSPPLLASNGRIYLAALQAAVAAVFGVDGGATPTPAGWIEHYVASLIIIIGGAARILGLTFACAAVCGSGGVVRGAASTLDGEHRRTFADLNAFCRERAVPPALADRLRRFFRSRVGMHSCDLAPIAAGGDALAAAAAPEGGSAEPWPLGGPARHQQQWLLARLPPSLRLEYADAVAPRLFGRISYLSPAGGVERPFLVAVLRALEPRPHCPREFIPPHDLTLLASGAATKHGRILRAGDCVGEDAVICRAEWRDAEPAIALTFIEALCLSRDALFALAAPYPIAAARMRRAAVRLALRRAFVMAARARVGQRQPGASLLGPDLFGLDGGGAAGTAAAAAAAANGDGELAEPPHALAARAMEQMEARVYAKLAELAAALPSQPHGAADGNAATYAAAAATAASSSASVSSPSPPTPAATVAPHGATVAVMGGAHMPLATPGGAPVETPADGLATAWPCTLTTATTRRRHGARSLDGRSQRSTAAATAGEDPDHARHHHHHHRTSSGRHSHRGGLASSRSAAGRSSHRGSSTSKAELLERIARLEAFQVGALCASATRSAEATPNPERPRWPEAPSKADGSSPPMSAERRFSATAARTTTGQSPPSGGAGALFEC